MLVDPELVRLSVVGDVDVDPPVAVEVGRRHAERRSERASDQGFGRDILERAVPAVVIEAAGLRTVTVRRAVVALSRDAQAVKVVFEAVVEIVAHEQIEPAVAVVVDE